MHTIEFASIFQLFVQLNLIIAGAASFWCFILALKGKFAKNGGEKWHELSLHLSLVFLATLILFILSWFLASLLIFTPEAAAHEGVVHGATLPQSFTINGYLANSFWVFIVILFNAAALLAYRLKRRSLEFLKNNSWLFFGINALLLSIILILATYTGEFSKEQIAFSLHNWHSILTLGTVICVDTLFLLTIKKEHLQRVLYPFYPLMSLAIWFGLGLDFISSFLIIGDMGFPGSEQFIFNQIVIIVLIVNGALLSVGINDALISLIKPDRVEKFSSQMERIVAFSGSVSIVSWLTVTLIDFFEIPLSLIGFAAAYLLLIIAAYITKPLLERQFLKLNIRTRFTDNS